jgi:hypothetical protein
MNYKFFFKRLILILFRPAKAWEAIHAEDFSVARTRNYFLLPFAVLTALTAFLGSFIFTKSGLTANYSVLLGLKFFLMPIIVTYASSFIVKEITYPLDLGRSYKLAFRLVNYALIPFFICLSLSLLLESLIFVNILGLFGLYIFWAGAEKMLNPLDYKKMPLLVSSAIVIISFYIAFSWFLTQVIERIYY